MGSKSPTGLVFDIQRYAIHDGPGIRTVVFLKGCPLHCLWCANPESINSDPELVVLPNKCIGCGKCVDSCPKGAVKMDQREGMVTDPHLCTYCGTCVEVCPAAARVIYGKEMTVEEVWREVKKDLLFFRNSGGGVTISGGEPGLQPDFVKKLAELFSSRGIHVAVETCGSVNEEAFSKVISSVDLVLFDLKHLDPEKHKEYTGCSNTMVIGNLKNLASRIAGGRKRPELVIRIPLIPGYNTQIKHLRSIAEFLRGLKVIKDIHLLPYHRLGEPKYKRLRRKYPLQGLAAMEESEAEEYIGIFTGQGFEVRIGG